MNRNVETSIFIHRSATNVISAFLEEEKLTGWWGVDKSLVEKKIGGSYILSWNTSKEGFGYVTTGIIEFLDKNGGLVIDKMIYMNPAKPILGPMTLSINAMDTNDGSEVAVCQYGYQKGPHWDWYYEAVKNTWPQVLGSLKRYLESID